MACCNSNSSLFFFRGLIVLFKVFGLAPSSTKIVIDDSDQEKNTFKVEFSYSLLGSIYSFLIITTIFCELIFSYIFWPIDNDIYLHIYNFIKKIGLIAIISTFSFKQKEFLKIIEKIYTVHNAANQSDYSGSLLRWEKFYKILSVSVYLTLSLILLTSYILSKLFDSKQNSSITNINIVIEYIIIFIVEWFITQYSLLLIFIYYKLCTFNESFVLCLKGDNNSAESRSTFLCDDILLKFNSLRRSYQSIYSALNDIIRFYSSPIFIAIVIIAPKLITVVNTTIVCNESCDDSILKVFNNLMMIFLYFPVINLTVFATKIKEESKRITNILYKGTTDGPGNLSSELERFSVELLHWKIDFTAYGFFQLDNCLITQIVCVSVLYMIINPK